MVDILKAMHSFVQKNHHPLVTYRIDRYASIDALQQTLQLEGFYSTCTYGYLPQYAHIKKDVVLLEICRDEDVPYLDFETLFENYAKKEEAELLLPCKAVVKSIEEVNLSNEEKELYYDMDYKAPVGKYRLYVAKPIYPSEDTYEYLTSNNSVQQLQECLLVLKNGENLASELMSFYNHWKESLVKYIGYCLQKESYR